LIHFLSTSSSILALCQARKQRNLRIFRTESSWSIESVLEPFVTLHPCTFMTDRAVESLLHLYLILYNDIKV